MVTMETTNCRRTRLKKVSSKKKKIHVNDNPKVKSVNHEEARTSTEITTPPRIPNTVTIVERGIEEVRGVEWQYHGKFVETDTAVVWGSPHGSPIVNKVPESPLSRPKRRTPCRTPRKLNTIEHEPPQFLNEILALSEKIKAEEGCHKESSTSENDKKEITTSKVELDNSFSNFFDEDMNECMLLCSQEFEETSSKQETGVKRENLNRNKGDREKRELIPVYNAFRSSPRRKYDNFSAVHAASGSVQTQQYTPEYVKRSPRVGNKNYVHCKQKINTYVFQGRVLGSRSPERSISRTNKREQCKINTGLQNNKSSCKPFLQTRPQETYKSSNSSTPCKSLNNSFEMVKESFLDNDLEFMYSIPDDIESTLNAESLQRTSSVVSAAKEKDVNNLPSATSELDDSICFEDGVFQYLDTIETNVTSSQTLRCTPEEIEKKRQEAKLKLQKKKRSSKK